MICVVGSKVLNLSASFELSRALTGIRKSVPLPKWRRARNDLRRFSLTESKIIRQAAAF